MSTIAVLGGGISGLTTAYYLSKLAPHGTKIILTEGSNRLGGWIKSCRVAPGEYGLDRHIPISSNADMTNDSNVLFEGGPRTLRPVGPGGVVTLDLIRDLNLTDNLIAIPKTHSSARHRYIYYEDRINTLPSSLKEMLLNPPPIMKSVLLSGMKEMFVKKSMADDESIYDFTERRFGTHVATNLVGAMVHGIYAGDAKELSLRTTLKMLWENEQAFGSVVRGMLRGGAKMDRFRERGMMTRARNNDPEWFGEMEAMSVIGFKDGVDSLTRALGTWLGQQDNVEIRTDEKVESLDLTTGGDCKIVTSKGIIHASHTVSTLPAIHLDKIISSQIPHLNYNRHADVAVVNLAYANDQAKLDYDGFGFLTPHVSSQHTHPVPGTLGVVFDSNALSGQERDAPLKLTAMLGGHMWDSAFDKSIQDIDPKVVRDRALQVAERHLGIKATPSHTMTHLHAGCIPQYKVGHYQRLGEMHAAIQSRFGNALSVTGASYFGVSVPDCIKNARELVEELTVSGALGSRSKVVTGLNRVEEGNANERLRDSANISKGHIDVLMKS
ncbi:hypothetical protein K450DRAFT_253193 [Umbelopsis ramanniana AG]|uniref:Protoporphyrinogen oxidase n=1 Tax=Umbelopsis ramanniana AG TaxID=1314678 RepID=A0AAD5HC43_UMBRA|nr:uncharacterized protein K450DRAFT_253193 [Umbelopsis ramanniana AG]KAI8577171.1 hypothetical protein K450DRAFT_253193 [Umbelopsis ramanniana AG]